jgi:hypothetical protein
MYPFPPLNHDQLLTLAHKTQGAARDHDRTRLEVETLHLFQALTDHVQAEHPAFLHIPPGDARLLERGQQRVVDLLVELAASATTDEGDCRCDRIAGNIVAELTLQTDDERRHLLTPR